MPKDLGGGCSRRPPKATQAARLELHRRQAAGDVTCGYEDGISCEQTPLYA